MLTAVCPGVRGLAVGPATLDRPVSSGKKGECCWNDLQGPGRGLAAAVIDGLEGAAARR